MIFMETPVLTREQVERAVRREEFEGHPVIRVLETNAPLISDVNRRYRGSMHSDSLHLYIREHFGFLAEAMERSAERAGGFPLGEYEIIAIGSKSMGVFPWTEDGRYDYIHHRYAVASMVLAVHGMQGVPNPESWRGFPRYYHETNEIPERARADRKGLLHVKGRLDDVLRCYSEIRLYLSGVRSFEIFKALLGKSKEGDEEAAREVQQIEAVARKHSTPMLNQIYENFGTGLTHIYYKIERVLEP